MSNAHERLERKLQNIASILSLNGYFLKPCENASPFGAKLTGTNPIEGTLLEPAKGWHNGKTQVSFLSIGLPDYWFIPSTMRLSKKYAMGFLNKNTTQDVVDTYGRRGPVLVAATNISIWAGSVVITGCLVMNRKISCVDLLGES